METESIVLKLKAGDILVMNQATFHLKISNNTLQKKKVTNLDASDDISAFTNTTKDTMETRIVNIETKFENLPTNLETLIEKSDIKRQQQVDDEMNKYQTKIDQEAKNNRDTINQIQNSLKLFLQQSLQQSISESNSPTSTTSNRTNRSNKSDDTKDSAKRKIDLLGKGKNELDNKKVKQIQKNNNKGGKNTKVSLEKKKTSDERGVKQEYINIAVQSQQQMSKGTDQDNEVINLLGNDIEPGTVDAVSGAT